MKKFDKSTRSLIHPDGSVYRIYNGKNNNSIIICTAVCYMEYNDKAKGKMPKL